MSCPAVKVSRAGEMSSPVFRVQQPAGFSIYVARQSSGHKKQRDKLHGEKAYNFAVLSGTSTADEARLALKNPIPVNCALSGAGSAATARHVVQNARGDRALPHIN